MQDVRAANVRALSDSLVLTCHRDDFQTHLGRLTDIRRLWRFEALRKVLHITFPSYLAPTDSRTCSARVHSAMAGFSS